MSGLHGSTLPALRLPAHFTPTHETSGLPGFPAVDVFAKGGTYVCAEFGGTVIKLSGHAPTETTTPGGPYGWSTYLALTWNTARKCWEDVYYMTHFGVRARQVVVGAKLRRGMYLGRVADYAKATGGVTPSHIHLGFHRGPWAP